MARMNEWLNPCSADSWHVHTIFLQDYEALTKRSDGISSRVHEPIATIQAVPRRWLKTSLCHRIGSGRRRLSISRSVCLFVCLRIAGCLPLCLCFSFYACPWQRLMWKWHEYSWWQLLVAYCIDAVQSPTWNPLDWTSPWWRRARLLQQAFKTLINTWEAKITLITHTKWHSRSDRPIIIEQSLNVDN